MPKNDIPIPRLSPPSRIGIVGGGQLGRMLTLEAKRMGYYVTVLDPKPQSPAGQVADAQIVAPFSDEVALRELANHSDVLTYEFEHIDAKHLINLEIQSHRIYPSPSTLQRIQNKYEQKELLTQLSVPVPEFYKIDSFDALKSAYRTLNGKLVLKSCTGGYDGKGNRIIKVPGELESAYAAFAGMDMMAEALVNYCMEVSIVVARNRDELILYPIAENIHKDSILIKSIIPAALPEQTSEQIRDITNCIIEALDDYGVFCIEFFVDAQYNALVNEIAPRPHNSGHYSIEGCVTSQFEQLVRVITGMPLGSAKLKSPSVMYNILGQERVTGDYRLEGAEALMELEDSHLHLYGKPDAGHLRKLGHITVLGETVEMAEAKARKAINHISIEKPSRSLMLNQKMSETALPLVGIIMGSESDLPVLKQAAIVLKACDIPFEIKVVSAHRTPERMMDYAKSAIQRGLEVIIAGAGGAAHLPGMVASMTSLPVIGVPVQLKTLEGLDSLLSIVQMPAGVPVATMGINNAKNAGILAARILGIKYPWFRENLEGFIAISWENIPYDLTDRLNVKDDNP